MSISAPRRLVLASTSVYRRELLSRLRLPFLVARPEADESPLAGETPRALALRLAEKKARAVAGDYPDALIIGSDQVAYCDGRIYGKPGTRERAIAQIGELSGKVAFFDTALCLLDAASGRSETVCVPTETRFRVLGQDEIERYVDSDQPLDCAGAAKSESLGVALLEYMRSDDPTALIGLPLIELCRMLRTDGVQIP
ncbi:MAG: Maf family nucleotide pyrophosphatase [Rhodocyclaceae bacterium]|nr:Maf family nucleotide pyrophosphatase [Rhodocyclaceae bacterium]